MFYIDDRDFLLKIPIVEEFVRAYYDASLTGYSAFLMSDDLNTGRKTVVVARSAIKGERWTAEEKRKYIAVLRFDEVGVLGKGATLDIISTPEPSHKEIFYRHAQIMGWVIEEDLPAIIAGGYITSFIPFKTEGSSEFGNQILGFDANEIVSAVIRRETNSQLLDFLKTILSDRT